MPRRRFGQWATQTFGYSKNWWPRLKQFACLYDDWSAAKEEAEVRGEEVVYSVDAAVKLAQRWRRAREGANGPRSKPRRESSSERLRQEFEERIARLEDELGRERRARQTMENDLTTVQLYVDLVGPTERARIEKIWELWRGGATEGERDAALARLREISDRLGFSLRTILRACKLGLPVWMRLPAA